MTKASDIADDVIVAVVVAIVRERRGARADRWTLAERLGYPEKVVLAKIRRLIRRGILEGCYCGCRGDLTTSDA